MILINHPLNVRKYIKTHDGYSSRILDLTYVTVFDPDSLNMALSFHPMEQTDHLKKIFIVLMCYFTLSVHAVEYEDCMDNSDVSNTLDNCLKIIEKLATDETPEKWIEAGFAIAELYQKRQNYEKSNLFLLAMEQQRPELTNQFMVRHRLLRQLGINHHHLKAYSQALQMFQKAFDIAEVQQDLLALSMSLNDLGVVYKAQSRYADSLSSYRQSLKIKETLGVDLEIAKSLYNIANVYLLMEKYDSAVTFYRRSLTIFEKVNQQDFDSKEQLIHIRDQIANSLSRMGDTEQAIEILQQSIIQNESLPDNELLLFETRCNLAMTYLQNDQTQLAYQAINQTKNIDSITSDQKLLRYEVYAEIYLAQSAYTTAEEQAIEGLNLALETKNSEQTSLFYRLLSDINDAQGNDTAALSYLKQFILSHENNLKQTYDTGIKYLQNEIELQQQQKNVSLLQKNNEIQELQIKKQRLVVISILLLAAFSALSVAWFIKKKATERKQLLSQINYHRNRLNEFKAPQKRFESFFKDVSEPLVCIDQAYCITYMNSAFRQLFELPVGSTSHEHLATFLPVFQASIQAITFNKDDLPEQQFVPLHIDETKQVPMWISVMLNMDNTIVFSIQLDQSAPQKPTESYLLIENSNQVDNIMNKLNALKNNNSVLTKDLIFQIDQKLKLADSGVDDLSQAYRKTMVDLMNSNLEVWRKDTQGDRISLAEQSGVWKVTIDDGRLRTRAMDRYFNLKSLPQTPRWRSVVKTSHYILAECKLSFEQRKYLNERLEVFMVNLKAISTGI